jgi:hypothetical protein
VAGTAPTGGSAVIGRPVDGMAATGQLMPTGR